MIARNETIMLQVAKEAIGQRRQVTMESRCPAAFGVHAAGRALGCFPKTSEERRRTRSACAPSLKAARRKRRRHHPHGAEGADEQALRREMAYLTRLWGIDSAPLRVCPTPSLYTATWLVFQTVRDVFTENTFNLLGRLAQRVQGPLGLPGQHQPSELSPREAL